MAKAQAASPKNKAVRRLVFERFMRKFARDKKKQMRDALALR
jgi:hypothetical protein